MSTLDLLLTVHVILAVFAVGPLVGAATTAARGVRTGDAAAAASSARILRIYSYASVLVVLVGFAMMSLDDPDHPGRKVAQFGDTWVWLSALLWLVAVAVVLAVLVPALSSVSTAVGAGSTAAALTGRVAAAGGVVGVLFAVVIGLMVYRPGGN